MEEGVKGRDKRGGNGMYFCVISIIIISLSSFHFHNHHTCVMLWRISALYCPLLTPPVNQASAAYDVMASFGGARLFLQVFLL